MPTQTRSPREVVPPVAQLDRLEDRRLFAAAGSAVGLAVAASAADAGHGLTVHAPGPSGHGPGGLDGGRGGGLAGVFGGGPRISLIAYDFLYLPATAGSAAGPATTASVTASIDTVPAAAPASVTVQAAPGTLVEAPVTVRTATAAASTRTTAAADLLEADDGAATSPAEAKPVVGADAAPAVLGTPAARPVVVGFLPAVSAASPAASRLPGGLADLLAGRTPAASDAVFTVALPAAARSRIPAATPDASDTDTGITVRPATAAAEAAVLPGPSGLLDGRSLWQKVAVSTAAAVIVSANWVVRRRNRKIALSVRRG